MSHARARANSHQLWKRDILVATRHLQVSRVSGRLCDVLVTLRHSKGGTERLGPLPEVMGEFVAEVRLVREVQFESDSFVRPAFGDQLLRQAAAECSRPLPRRLLKAFREVPLQLAE